MTLNEIEQWYSKVVELLRQQRVYEAIDYLERQTSERFQPGIDDIRYTYSNILAYTGKGISDPMSHNIYTKLLMSLYELADLIKLHLVAGSGSKIAALKADLDKHALLENEDLSENLMGLSFDNELNDILHSASLFNDESESESAIHHRKAIFRAFMHLWLTDKFSEKDEEVITRIFDSSSLPWFEKAMMVSALTLGTIRIFDQRRISVLIDLFGHEDPQISQRALFGCIISFLIYDKRFYYYPNLMEKINLLENEPVFREDALNMIIQFNRSKDTEQATRKFEKEVLPQVIKFNEDLNEKLDLEKLLEEGEPLDKNPDWEKYFDSQPELTKKLEELTNMQMEGVDVFLSAFAMLKAFPFFNEIPNWFMPFYSENHAVQEALVGESDAFKGAFLKGLELSMYMCNSDKFSFAFNIRFLPEQQKNMMVQMFESEAEQLAELKNEELSEPALIKKRIAIQYIQDLYRFFKLHTLRLETGDIFKGSADIQDSAILTGLISDPQFYRTIANFFLDNAHYESAFKLYNYLIEKGENYAELYEKSGYCQQMDGNYNEAILIYQRADLFDTNHNWLLQKQAQCCLSLDNPEGALHYYLELLEFEPDNQKVIASIGTCYLELGKPEQAIEYFYRIEFANSGSSSAMRTVAWCLFLLNRMEEADTYYNQLLESEPNTFDFMNAGHVAFCLGRKETAVKHYLNSIATRKDDLKSFIKGFNKDRKYLLSNGVDASEVALMLDYLRFGKRDSVFI